MPPASSCLIEACVTSPGESERAVAAGAGRLELSATLAGGGVTPTAALVQRVVRAVDVDVIALVRVPGRGPGGFQHDPRAFAWLLDEIDGALAAGAHGVAIGVLDERGAIDARQLQLVVRHAEPRTVVFHRAFDLLADPVASIEALVDAGVERVLTSGGARTAHAGRRVLARLVQAARERLSVLAGGGVGPENARELVRDAGLRELHGSFRGDAFGPASKGLLLDFELPELVRSLDADRLRATLAAVRSLGTPG